MLSIMQGLLLQKVEYLVQIPPTLENHSVFGSNIPCSPSTFSQMGYSAQKPNPHQIPPVAQIPIQTMFVEGMGV